MSDTVESILTIENVRLKANHGWYESERKIGGMYTLNVRLFKILDSHHVFSHLDHTINYEIVHRILLETMEEEHHLIESACKTIWDKLKSIYPNEIWEVTIQKEQVPLKYVGSTSYQMKG